MCRPFMTLLATLEDNTGQKLYLPTQDAGENQPTELEPARDAMLIIELMPEQHLITQSAR